MYPRRGDPGRGGGYSNRPRGGRGGYSSRGGRERSDFDGRNYAYGNDAGGGYGGNSGGGGFDGSGGGGGYDRSSSGPVFGGSSRGGYGGNPASPAFGGNVGRGGFGGSSGGFGGGGFGRSSGGGGFGGRSSGGFQLAGSPPNDTTQWPPSDGGSGSGGFGTLIDDSSIFLNPRPPREAPTPVPPFGGVIPEGRHDYTSPRGRGRGGYGRLQPGDRRNSDNNRRNGMAGRPPTPPVAEEKVDPERVALVEKFKELMNDDGGVYTSDEEEKTPRKDDKEPTPRKDDKEPSPKEDDKKAVEPTPAEPSYDAAPIPDAPIRQQMNSGPSRRGRGSHNHSFRPKPVSKPSPLPAPEPAMEPEEDADAKDEKFADSILLTLLCDQGMRETLKKHDPELFDLMVKHIAVVALNQA